MLRDQESAACRLTLTEMWNDASCKCSCIINAILMICLRSKAGGWMLPRLFGEIRVPLAHDAGYVFLEHFDWDLPVTTASKEGGDNVVPGPLGVLVKSRHRAVAG